MAAKKTVTKNPSDVKRAAYVRQMASAWLKRNRGDVWETIQRLANEKFPKTGRGRKPVDLPKELADMK